ncbi:MAG: cation:proton antiporter [Methanomassiliicoccaceae archaeon]|jgi:Kef-type K+ transport system membrane component KefB|nr:cation:proton antiporter [Methanomassiliicoccaceae archaeon]
MAELDMGQLLIILSVLFVLAFSASTVMKRFGIPGLIGEILVGVLVANVIIGDWSFLEDTLNVIRPGLDEHGVFADGNLYWSVIEALAQLGVIFLLFTVGLETKVKDLTSFGRTALLVAILGVVIPLILGYAVIMVWYGDIYVALFMGAAMVATSVGITAQVIRDMHLMSASESRIIIGAAVIDDILGIIVLTIVAGMAATGTIDITDVAEVVIISSIFVIAVIVLCSKGMPRIAGRLKAAADGKWMSKIDLFAVAVIICLVMSALAAEMRLAPIIGAFLAGMIFADHAHDHGLDKKLSTVTALLLPFFFVYVGLHIDVRLFDSELIILALIIIVLAIISKYIGCGLGTMISDRKKESSPNIVGIGMIPRGEVGIIVALIGVKMLLESNPYIIDVFAIVVLMSVVTTVIAPFVLSRAFKKKYGKRA